MELPLVGNKKTILIVAVVALILVIIGMAYAAYIQKWGQRQPAADQTVATTSARVLQNTGVPLIPQSTRQLSNQEFIDLINRSATTTAGILVERQ